MAFVEHPERSQGWGFSTNADDTPRVEGDPTVAESPFAHEDAGARWDAYARSDWDDASAWKDEPSDSADLTSERPRLAGFLAAALGAAVLAFLLAFFATNAIRAAHPRQVAQRQAPAPTPPGTAVRETPALPPAPQPSTRAATAGAVAVLQPAAPHHHATATIRRPSPKAATRRLLAPLDCARPASAAQRLVCGDPGLLAQDRRMARAYAQARAAGAPPQRLRRDQMRWLKAREAAARRSRPAVESLYSRRIQALESRPYRACVTAAASAGRPSLAGAARWLLSVPRKIVSPRRAQAGCG